MQTVRGIPMTPTTGAKTKKILVEFPEDLLEQIRQVAEDLSTDRSKVIRNAVRSFLRKREAARIAQELAEGYQAFADLDMQIVAEFDGVDSENF
jgi:metal-responsive CopG/Arc/MetJ family transcriptional regulator